MALNLKTETAFTGDAVTAQPPLPPEQIAPHFPQLEIHECLGRGGMGVVYKARQKALNRLVALKLMAPERVNDVKFADRFSREARALAALNHPNIVTIHDFGQAGGFYFLLMEFVDGLNLRRLLQSRKLSPEEALAIVPSICDALQYAHGRGIVHRDIKPENILLDKDGRLKIADFGIAKMLGASNSTPASHATECATQSAFGTPGYSAPEQKNDPQRADTRADIYSTGVVFYEMLTGELPGKKIEPPSKKIHIDVRLDAVVMRALENTPELRWQTAADLRAQVETIATTLNSGADAPNFGAITPADFNAMRMKTVIWGFLFAAGCLEIAFNVSPAICSWIIGTWGVVLSAVSIFLVLFAKGKSKQVTVAAIINSCNGIGTACAAIWTAYISEPALSRPWFDTIVVACSGGILYCLRCLVRLSSADFVPSHLNKRNAYMNKSAVITILIVLCFAAVLGVAALLWPGNSQKETQRGWQLWQERKFSEASEMFNKAVKDDPKNADAWNGLGWASFNSGDAANAERDFQKVLSLNPNHPAALNGLGQSYLSQKKYDDAEKYLLQAAPGAPAAWFGLARLYLLEGKFDEAQKWAQQVVDSGQGDQTASQMLQAAKNRQIPDYLRTMIEPQ